MRKSALYIILTLLIASSCNKVLMELPQMGSISLSLFSDEEVALGTKVNEADCSDFLVDIYGETVSGSSYTSETYEYGTMPQIVSLPYGYYNVTAQSCLASTAESGYGCVRYQGVSERVDILSQTPANVTVTCKMVNGKVTITFEDSFLEDFDDVEVELTSTRTVSLTSEQANTPVYFNLPAEGSPLVYTIKGTVAKGTPSEKKLSYTNASSPMLLMPAKWAKIKIKSNHNGVIGPGVDVDDEMGSDSFVEFIDPEEGTTVVDGTISLPSIIVDTQINPATVIDCIIDVY